MTVPFPSLGALPLNSPAPGSTGTQASNAAGQTFHQVLANASSETDQIAGVAKQFEALVAGQVLKSARESEQGGWLGEDDDETGELTLEMAEQSFAQALANQGGFGIAKIVTASLERKHSKAASSGSTSSPAPVRPSKEAKD
jgi:Rod binding domain-containing protein